MRGGRGLRLQGRAVCAAAEPLNPGSRGRSVRSRCRLPPAARRLAPPALSSAGSRRSSRASAMPRYELALILKVMQRVSDLPLSTRLPVRAPQGRRAAAPRPSRGAGRRPGPGPGRGRGRASAARARGPAGSARPRARGRRGCACGRAAREGVPAHGRPAGGRRGAGGRGRGRAGRGVQWKVRGRTRASARPRSRRRSRSCLVPAAASAPPPPAEPSAPVERSPACGAARTSAARRRAPAPGFSFRLSDGGPGAFSPGSGGRCASRGDGAGGRACRFAGEDRPAAVPQEAARPRAGQGLRRRRNALRDAGNVARGLCVLSSRDNKNKNKNRNRNTTATSERPEPGSPAPGIWRLQAWVLLCVTCEK